jgi:hypothetical protein
LALAEEAIEIGDRAREAVGEGGLGMPAKNSLGISDVGTALRGIIDG